MHIKKNDYICKPYGRFIIMNDSKEHIISIACKLFLQKSFKEVTMREIVVETGLSKGAFYHYFNSKEELFMEVLGYFYSNIFAHPYEKYSKDSFYNFYHDYANNIVAVSKIFLEKFKENGSDNELSMNYFSLAFDAVKLMPEFRKQMIIEHEKELKIWTDVIKNARKKGEIKTNMTDEELANTFIYLSDGFAINMVMKGSYFDKLLIPIVTLWDKIYEQIKA